MSLNRRDFVKLCTGTVAGFGVAQMFHPAVREALAGTLTGERPPVIWLQGQGCTGCSVSLLNNVNPSIADVLLKIISLEYHPTVMGGEGHDAYTHMLNIAKNFKGKFFLAIEGSIPLAKDGRYCVVAEEGHTEITMADLVKKLAPDAAAVLALGTCAAYGGIPAAKGSVTEAMGTGAMLKQAGIKTPVVNIPGCPPQPDWIVGTIALALQKIKEKGLEAGLAEVVSLLDSEGRPLPFYGRNVHENCPYLGKYDEGKFSATFTEKDGCRYVNGTASTGAWPTPSASAAPSPRSPTDRAPSTATRSGPAFPFFLTFKGELYGQGHYRHRSRHQNRGPSQGPSGGGERQGCGRPPHRWDVPRF